MMTDATSEEASAINTASASAWKPRLNPSGNARRTSGFSPASTCGSSASEQTNDVSTKINAKMFRARGERRPMSGSRNAPMSGVNMQTSKVPGFVIKSPVHV